MIKTGKDLATACLNVALNYKTLYVMGCFGAPMTARNKVRYTNNHDYNMKEARQKMIQAASEDTFGFDCVNLIKGLLWGWDGDTGHIYGGADYACNGVPDTSADGMIGKCKTVSTDFSNVEVGELLWMKGHVGIYIGDGLCVECTPAWKNCVQVTAVHNIGKKEGYNGRKWTKHGKLPYVAYPAPVEPANKIESEEECDVKVKVLKQGSSGAAVRALQTLLIGYDYGCGASGADGSFGPATDKALRRFQRAHGLTADGSCGPATWARLLGV